MTTWADTKRQKDANARASRVLMASSVYAANWNAVESSGQQCEIDEEANQRPVVNPRIQRISIPVPEVTCGH